jgi:DNA invertase Pin-like site-specific DNA recombinase
MKTKTDNVRRGPCHGQAKLSAEQVKQMRRMYDARSHGTATYTQLARFFGVGITTVYRVLKREVYPDVI